MDLDNLAGGLRQTCECLLVIILNSPIRQTLQFTSSERGNRWCMGRTGVNVLQFEMDVG